MRPHLVLCHSILQDHGCRSSLLYRRPQWLWNMPLLLRSSYRHVIKNEDFYCEFSFSVRFPSRFVGYSWKPSIRPQGRWPLWEISVCNTLNNISFYVLHGTTVLWSPLACQMFGSPYLVGSLLSSFALSRLVERKDLWLKELNIIAFVSRIHTSKSPFLHFLHGLLIFHLSFS